MTVSGDIPAGAGFDTLLNVGVVPVQTSQLLQVTPNGQSTAPSQPAQSAQPTQQPSPVVPGTLGQADVATLLASLGLTVDDQGHVVRIDGGQPVDWSNIAIATPGVSSGQGGQNQTPQSSAQPTTAQVTPTPTTASSTAPTTEICLLYTSDAADE